MRTKRLVMDPIVTDTFFPNRFEPEQLGELILATREDTTLAARDGTKPPPTVTLLFGAGCSKSVNIPLAGEIVKDLRANTRNPFLRQAPPSPNGISEYAFLMAILGSPKARAAYIKKCIQRADRDSKGRLKINWSHLLLAAMVEKGYIHRILTTNFDPLIVEALAITGQPIRTYDLSLTGKYDADILDSGSVIYLHGQMHSLLLSNTKEEMDQIKNLYPSVLQEAVRDSFLIVVGYSGDCDPVLKALAGLTSLPHSLWWSHYSPSGAEPGDGVRALAHKHGTNFHLARGYDADTFMRKLVLDGMQLALPDEILSPITATRQSLERITPFPLENQKADDVQANDPLAKAVELVTRAEQLVKGDLPVKPSTATGTRGSSKVEIPIENLPDLDLAVRLEMAAVVKDWDSFDRLRKEVTPNPSSPLSQTVGDGLLRRSSLFGQEGDFRSAVHYLRKCEEYGVKSDNLPRLPTLWGNTLSDQAKFKGNTPEADRLFSDAYKKFTEAIRLKSDMYEAYNSWGVALSDQAKLKGNHPEADRLFAEAYKKLAEAIRIKPDMHEAFNSWGVALSDQAKLKGNTTEGNRLFAEAYKKLAEAIRIKPDKHVTFNNWGAALLDQAGLKKNSPEADVLFAEAQQKFNEALRIKPDDADIYFNQACIAALRGNSKECIPHLQKWAKLDFFVSRSKLDNDSDFDSVRDTPEFKAFRDTLPD